MSAVVVKRFVNEWGQRYSIRRHDNGAFQAYHDNPWEGLEHYRPSLPEPFSGLFSDAKSAEMELRRIWGTSGLTEVLYKDGNNP